MAALVAAMTFVAQRIPASASSISLRTFCACRKHQLSGIGEDHAIVSPVEQLRAYAFFEGRQLLGKRRLRKPIHRQVD
jgi:hypothetical protein